VNNLSSSSGDAATNTEVTLWTSMSDMARKQYYIRPINSINFSMIDIPKLANVKELKKVSLDQIAQLHGADATELFLK
jgi:penicillin V acylase-like amidase (Ntn superfamily)